MNQTPADPSELYQMLMRITNKKNQIDRTLYNYGLAKPLYISEMHILQAIGSTSDKNVGAIAKLTGVSPSAASQVITKLKNRGLVQKIRGVRNEKEVLLKLTPQGLIAYRNHEKIHTDRRDRIFQEIGPLSVEERATLTRVFSAIERIYDQRIEEIGHKSKGREKTSR